MKAYTCARCGQLLFFENSACLACGVELGYQLGADDLVVYEPPMRRCANARVAGCNWLVAPDDPVAMCVSCRLTRTRPNDNDRDAMAAFAVAESAKRQLLQQVLTMGLPVVSRAEDPVGGLAFDFLSSRNQEVLTGHENGVITLDLSESDAVHREFVKLQLGEPYRTVLGHLRHEIGHYFWPLLTGDGELLAEFRTRFGDESESYEHALERHYRTGPAPDWPSHYVSAYATMHPWEDWAETFAHYLHIDAGLVTARSFGLESGLRSRVAARRALEGDAVSGAMTPMIEEWLSVSFALNAMAKALGQEALYPFVLSIEVREKLDFVHRCVRRAALHVTA